AMPSSAPHGVHFGSIRVDLATMLMHDFADRSNAFLENAVCGGIRNHKRGQSFVVLLGLDTQISNVDVAIGIRLDRDHVQSRHDGTSRVRAVRGLRNETNITMILALRF